VIEPNVAFDVGARSEPHRPNVPREAYGDLGGPQLGGLADGR
jgi:hypothetical protein